ncbi:MAG: anti-sigma factor family protein, partial [Chitinophagales bacterium]
MACYESPALREYLDRELSPELASQVEKHLEGCSSCRGKLQRLMENDRFVGSALSKYHADFKEENFSAHAGWTGLEARIKKERTRRLKEMTWKYRRVAAVAAITLCLAGSLAFGNVRGAVADFLSVFRVEKVQTITVSQQDMEQIAQAVQSGIGEIDIKDFGTINVSGKEEYLSNLSPAEARETVGFDVMTPDSGTYGQPLINVQKSPEMSLNLNVAKVNQTITSLGGTQLLPEDLQDKTFNIKIHPVISMLYFKNGEPAVTLSASRSPEMEVPGGVDVLAVRDALLSLPFWPDNVKQQLQGIDDWQHTMVLP